MLRDYEEGYKIIIVGSSEVGKSSLHLRFVDNIFSEKLSVDYWGKFQIQNIRK